MTDAVKAGERPATIMTLVSNLALPAVFWFFIKPTFFGSSTAEPLEEGAEPVEPATWTMWLIKTFGMFAVMAVCLLLMIYFKQESMLYVPSQPYQDMDENPPRYKNPSVRSLSYENIDITSEDGVKLHGWLMTSGLSQYKNKDTIVFMHENAGNIGLRLDYFEHICNNIGCNIVAIAYRGYSKS